MAQLNISELYTACNRNEIATVQRLLQNTPVKNLNRLEPNGDTCLHVASSHDNREIVRLLLARGAGRRIKNRKGFTPLDLARTEETAGLFRRPVEARQQRFSNNPARQIEWQFQDDSAESFSRATHWGCIKNRGIKNTVRKLIKKNVLGDERDKSTELVACYFNDALEKKDPVWLLKAYTVESPFYRHLNSEMATGSRREVFKKLCKKWTGYYTGVIAKHPDLNCYHFSGQTYRGMTITSADYAPYKLGAVLSNKSFQSTSKSWTIAKQFAYPPQPRPRTFPVIIIFTILDPSSALDINEISEYQDEEEVLIVPGTLFIVANINENEVPYEIELRQIQWNNEF